MEGTPGAGPRKNELANRTSRQGEAENQVAPTAPTLAAARADRHELFAIHHVHRGRREDATARVELPEQLTGLGVIRHQVAGCIAAAADEDDVARGDDRSGLPPAVVRLLPHQLTGRGIVRREIPFGGSSAVERLVDRIDVEISRSRTVRDRTVAGAASCTRGPDLIWCERGEH